MWLHYDERKDLAFYFLCMKAVKKNTLITSRCADKAIYGVFFKLSEIMNKSNVIKKLCRL